MDVFLTVSIGALLAVPVAALAGLIITPRGDRGSYLRLGATALVGAAVGAGLSLKVNPVIGLATAVVIAGEIDWLLGRASWDPKKALVLVGGLLVLLGVFIAERSHHPIPLSATSFPVLISFSCLCSLARRFSQCSFWEPPWSLDRDSPSSRRRSGWVGMGGPSVSASSAP